MIQYSNGVYVRVWTPQLAEYHALLDAWSHWSDTPAWITAIDNGQHSARSFHGFSLAVDSSVFQNVREQLEDQYEYLRRHAPHPWELILESDHVHAEWDLHRKAIILAV